MPEEQEALSVVEQIFKKYFENLKASPDLDEAIIKKLHEIHKKGDLADPSVFDGFVEWLEKYDGKNNTKNKEPAG